MKVTQTLLNMLKVNNVASLKVSGRVLARKAEGEGPLGLRGPGIPGPSRRQ